MIFDASKLKKVIAKPRCEDCSSGASERLDNRYLPGSPVGRLPSITETAVQGLYDGKSGSPEAIAVPCFDKSSSFAFAPIGPYAPKSAGRSSKEEKKRMRPSDSADSCVEGGKSVLGRFQGPHKDWSGSKRETCY